MSLQLTAKQLSVYRRAAQRRWQSQQREVVQRRRRAWRLAHRAAELLKQEYGATRVVVFGSLAHGAWFHAHSDLDLAVEGLPPGAIWRAWSAVGQIGPGLSRPDRIGGGDRSTAPAHPRARQGTVKAHYRLLAQRIRDEVAEVERTIDAVWRHWRRFQKARVDQDAYLNSVGLNLHSFYVGVERVLELIALEFDGGTLGGETWHAELLRQMTLDVPRVRPLVLSQASHDWLDDYRKFRHRVRNIYATNLVPDRMKPLVKALPVSWR